MIPSYSRTLLSNLLAEIRKVKDYEFPNNAALEAVRELEARTQILLNTVNAINPAINDDHTRLVFQRLVPNHFRRIIVLLGFLIRSTNIRNCFEIHGPLLRMAKLILGPKTKLIISSEWEFSPFVYNFTEETFLKNYILIGFPATESSYPFLIPWSGHELGHPLWHKERMQDKLNEELPAVVCDVLLKKWDASGSNFKDEFKKIYKTADRGDINKETVKDRPWKKIILYSEQQIIEVFCDFVGLYLFKSSFLYSYLYYASLANFLPRTPNYPSIEKRAMFLRAATLAYNIELPEIFIKPLHQTPLPSTWSDETKLHVSIADAVTESMAVKIQKWVSDILGNINLPKYDKDRVEQAVHSFLELVPADGCESISEIMEAAWTVYHDTDKWRAISKIKENEDLILSDLVIKSFEIFEIEKRTKS